MASKRIIYLSYGRETEYLRTIFSILSFVSWCKDSKATFKILIYSDNSEYLQEYLDSETVEIEYFSLTPKVMNSMLNSTGFNHRIKVEVVSRTFTDYVGDDILFLDSDTFFVRNPALILDNFRPNECFMHKREYTLHEGKEIFAAFGQSEYPTNFLNYIESKDLKIRNGIQRFSGSDYSWNSGVIGLRFEQSVYIDDILRLTDEFYSSTKWFLSEQLAFSLVLSRTAKIKPAEDIVVHYWGGRQKKMMDRLIHFNAPKFKKGSIIGKKFIKSRTKVWHKYIQADLIIEQAVIAFTHRTWWFFVKKVTVLSLKYPTFLWQLIRELIIMKN